MAPHGSALAESTVGHHRERSGLKREFKRVITDCDASAGLAARPPPGGANRADARGVVTRDFGKDAAVDSAKRRLEDAKGVCERAWPEN